MTVLPKPKLLLQQLWVQTPLQQPRNNPGRGGGGGGTLNVEVAGVLVGNFLENPKKYPDFDFQPLKIPKLQF